MTERWDKRERAQVFRRNPTPGEEKLWSILRANRAGFPFRRQYPIAGFIADFCSPHLRVIIEVDGPVHGEQVDQDAYRDDVLRGHGFVILRFTNEDVEGNLFQVKNHIIEACRAQSVVR